MKKRPDCDVAVTLFCPACGNKLLTDVCEQCGQEINTQTFYAEIDINPEEILQKISV